MLISFIEMITLAAASALLALPLAIVFSLWCAALVYLKYIIPSAPNTIAFFHPTCDMGGGGERVLWTAIRAIQLAQPSTTIAVYIRASAEFSNCAIMHKVQLQFGLDVNAESIVFVPIHLHAFLDPTIYPAFTLILQSIGSMVVATEALWRLKPCIFIDTVGYAFTYPISTIVTKRTVSYTHYPTISTNMLERVRRRDQAHNNLVYITSSPLLTVCKLVYYRLFAILYGLVGQCSSYRIVNSSWTDKHIRQIWRCETHILYPPCDMHRLLQINSTSSALNQIQKGIISIAQFRPEKNHMLQINAAAPVLRMYPTITLTLAGSCRNAADSERVSQLQVHIDNLGLSSQIYLLVNSSSTELQEALSKSLIGLHTMRDEHFGIGVVEYMAAGVIAIAHDSGGPRDDIVREIDGRRVGFLAETEADYTQAILQVVQMSEHEVDMIRRDARRAVKDRFSSELFDQGIMDSICTVNRIK